MLWALILPEKHTTHSSLKRKQCTLGPVLLRLLFWERFAKIENYYRFKMCREANKAKYKNFSTRALKQVQLNINGEIECLKKIWPSDFRLYSMLEKVLHHETYSCLVTKCWIGLLSFSSRLKSNKLRIRRFVNMNLVNNEEHLIHRK